MMIKKRLIISNILMLIVPAILIVVIAGGVLEGFTEIYGKKIRGLNDENGTYFVQRAINSYSKSLKNIDMREESFEKFGETLNDAGYNLLVTSNENTIFSNLTDEDRDSISKLQSDILSSSDSMVLEVNSVSLIKNTITKNNKSITLLAVKSSNIINKDHMRTEVRSFFVSYMGIVFIIALLIIIFTNGILSSRVAKSVIKPLELLSYGAGQIEEGNLDFKMNYEGNDEFAKVCSDFDKMRIRLQESVHMQLKYEENRKELVAGISHDLRTPLTTIKGYIKGLKDGVANTPEKRERYHEIIYNKACDMDMLVDKLFLFSKLDTGKFPFHFEIVNCIDFFQSFFVNAVDEFKGKGLNLSYENSCDNNILISIDIEEMNRVLVNILENSVRYKTKECGNVNIIIDQKEENIILKIKDDGPGVLEENLNRLFVSFYREDSARTNPGEGSGLGLSISEYIVRAHGGTISAENMNGLAIVITLPISNYEGSIYES
ncbi:sensor histidine kinase [Clostridium chromiireducens]|uniref:histidine kinase n=1 Tax=Clostridium chromiireducens TaxID=225345 RepID=A0A1V4IKS2_9CLOT|nr:HAMP domain-containing sensor histidine kinase [Clostridium chromiireducens]OPJ60424.1 sensor histidine kinase YycG [Clostridium chromiireducens]